MLVVRTAVTLSDRKGATEQNCLRIASIDSLDALGYRGRGREEHSGENAPCELDDLWDELADNRAGRAPAA